MSKVRKNYPKKIFFFPLSFFMSHFFLILFLIVSIQGMRVRHRETPTSDTSDSSDGLEDYDDSLTLMAYFYNNLFDEFRLTDTDEEDFESCLLGLSSKKRSKAWSYGDTRNLTHVMQLVKEHFDRKIMYK